MPDATDVLNTEKNVITQDYTATFH